MADCSNSPLQTLVAVLEKLKTEEFVSTKIEKDAVIRKQIEILVRSEELSELAVSLHGSLTSLRTLSPPPDKNVRKFQAHLWP